MSEDEGDGMKKMRMRRRVKKKIRGQISTLLMSLTRLFSAKLNCIALRYCCWCWWLFALGTHFAQSLLSLGLIITGGAATEVLWWRRNR